MKHIQGVRWVATLPALRATSPYAGEAFEGTGVRIATASVRTGLAMTWGFIGVRGYIGWG